MRIKLAWLWAVSPVAALQVMTVLAAMQVHQLMAAPARKWFSRVQLLDLGSTMPNYSLKYLFTYWMPIYALWKKNAIRTAKSNMQKLENATTLIFPPACAYGL